MKNKANSIFLLILLVGLCGCATEPKPRLATPSGRPEVTIPGVTTKQVIDRVVAGALQKGTRIIRVNDYEVVLGQKIEGSVMTSLLYGSNYDTVPEARVTVNVVQTAAGAIAYSRAEMVTNPGSAFERTTDITEQAENKLQADLEGVRRDLVTVSADHATEQPTKPVSDIQPTEAPSVNKLKDTEQGAHSYEAEKQAMNAGCQTESGVRPAASLIQQSEGLEVYDIQCRNQHMMVRCEYRQCRLLK